MNATHSDRSALEEFSNTYLDLTCAIRCSHVQVLGLLSGMNIAMHTEN